MCNLNIFVKSVEGGDKLVNLIVNSTQHSYERNNHGEGVFFSSKGILDKGESKRNYIKHIKDILKSSFILTHQRIATSGKTEEFTQPFKNKEFVLLHNGIMSEYEEKDETKSDTHNLFTKFIDEFGKMEGLREEKIIKAIKVCLDKTKGSYSIGIYDRKMRKLYYFKSWVSSIYGYINKRGTMFYLTTSNSNDDFIPYYFSNKWNKVEIEDYVIYVITVEDKVKIREVGKIEKKEECFSWSRDKVLESKVGIKDIEGINKFVKKEARNSFMGFLWDCGFERSKEIHVCHICRQNKTNLVNNATGLFECNKCLREEFEEWNAEENAEIESYNNGFGLANKYAGYNGYEMI